MTVGDMEIGSLVYLSVDGEQTAFRVMHHGKPSAAYDDSWAGGTVVMLDHTESPVKVSMVSGLMSQRITYKASNGHQVLNSTWLGRLDADMAEAVRAVKLPYRTDTTGTFTVAVGSDGLPAKVWLPSVAEVGGSGSKRYVEEGAVLDYWAEADSDQYALWKYINAEGTDSGWGTRTPNSSAASTYAACFQVILTSGLCANGTGNTSRVRPCLVLPDGLPVDTDGCVRAVRTVPCKIDGAWREGAVSVKINGAWSDTAQPSVKVGGAWKE